MFIVEPKKELVNEPYEIGETFAVPISAIKCLYINGEPDIDFKVDEFQWYFTTLDPQCLDSDVTDMFYKIYSSYTLLSYVGNGKFIEFYSKKTINLSELKEYDPKSLIKKYREIVDEDGNEKNPAPLCVLPSHFEQITNDIKTNMLKSDKNLFSQYFDALEKSALTTLKDKLHKVILLDWEYAEKEDEINSFIKIKK